MRYISMSVLGGGCGGGSPASAKDKLFLASTITFNFHCTLYINYLNIGILTKPDIAS